MKNVILMILKIILFLLSLTFLELNRNTILGWIAAIVLFIIYFYLSRTYAKNIFHGFLFLLGYLLVFALIVYISWPPIRNVPAVTNKNPQKTEVYNTAYGQVQGVLNKDESVEVFAGIPFAKPPIGQLRWKAPEDPESWDGVLFADHFAPMSMQETSPPIYDSLTQIIGYHDYKISLDDNYRPPVSEDSLYLNIWKPADASEKLPVMVYIHGGSLESGQPWYADYNGEKMASKGMIFVTITYRLGVFGFYGDEQLCKESGNITTGNYGFLDMIKALEWVKENIDVFGGDPDNITVAGESAGSAAVSALCTSPLASGLFERVILESSTLDSPKPPHSYRSYEQTLEAGKKTRENYGVNSIEELRLIPAEELVKQVSLHHHITVDGYSLLEDPYLSYKKGIHNEKAILHGYNSEESGPFILFSKTTLKNYEEKISRYFGDYTGRVLEIFDAKTDEEAAKYWAQIYGDVFFTYSHYCLNRLANENGIPVYEYFFSKNNGRLGSWHSGEEIYAYDNIPASSKLFDEKDRNLSKLMSSYWYEFALKGDPNVQGLETWPINKDNETLLELGEEVRITNERSQKLYDIMDEMYGWK
ncbi:MAG: carboxylesterase family protein [Erysipelotrichaceae bacterium]|nr:carboxylesterase family protein [Erysipelotrichaceae bacterium]